MVEASAAVAVLMVSFSSVGVLIASYHSGNSIGWLFCAAALFQRLSNSGYEYLPTCSSQSPARFLWEREDILAQGLDLASGLGLILVFLHLMFPEGHPPSRCWRPVAWLRGLCIGLTVVSTTILL